MTKKKSNRENLAPQPTVANDTASFLPGSPLLLALLLIAVTALCYFPAWNGKPIWDDDAHLTKPELRSVEGLARIWIEPGATQQYYPLVHSVFWIEHQLWGDNPLPYHLVNILLHAVSALLLLRILQRLQIPGAWLAAAIFALHPVQVESVAWISELKNTLSGVFFLTALLVYLRFDQSRRRRAYLIALALFVLGLLCKTVIATMPAVLLVIFWWQRGKLSWKRDVLPLVPFFAAGISAGLFTAWVERSLIGAQGDAFNLTSIDRCLIAGRAFWFYLVKLLWPADLIFVYPRWRVSGLIWWQYLFPLAALLLFVALFAVRKRWRGPLAALLIFAGMLLPALGFLNVYPFIYSFVADHFQYLASIGVITLGAAGITLLFDRFKLAPGIRYFLVLSLLALLATLTWRQARIYRDPETLYRTTLQRNPACWMALNNMGVLLVAQNRPNEAIAYCEQTLRLRPDYAEAELTFGNVLLKTQQPDAAIPHFEKALRLTFDEGKIGEAKTYYFLGNAFLQKGQWARASANYEIALQTRFEYASDAHNNLGNALLEQGRMDEAIHHYEKVVELRFHFSKNARAKAEYNLANALSQSGRLDEAIVHYQRALALQPAYAEAHNNLGRAFLLKHQTGEAIAHYEKAVELAPQSSLFQNNLAWQLATCSDLKFRDGAKAVALAGQANQLSGGKDPAVLNTLAAAYAEDKQFSKAVATAQEALRLTESGGDPGLVEVLRHAIALYQANLPYQAVPR